MPQLDVATYFSQLFWLGFFFILLLVVSTRFMLPRVAFIHKKRWEKIEGTREQALALQHQAQQVQTIFEQHLAQARTQAQEKMLQASKEILQSQESVKSDINRRLKDQFKSFESKVSLEKDTFMGQVQSIAQSLAIDIAQKVLKEKLPSDFIEQSVRHALTEKAVDNYVS